jgi:hypothetical protein
VRDDPQTVAADPSTHTSRVIDHVTDYKGNSISVIER